MGDTGSVKMHASGTAAEPSISLGGRRSAAAAEHAYRQLRPGLLRYLDRLTGDREAACDLVQETFVRMLRTPPSGDVKTWVFVVATNLARDHARLSTRRRQLLRTQDLPRHLPQPDAAMERKQTIAEVRAALSELSERDRSLLLLRGEGFKYKEIARTLDVSPGSVGTLMARALRRFSMAYQETGQ